MLRQALVEEGEVGVEEVEHAAVLADDALEEQLRLLLHRRPQFLVEGGEEGGVGGEALQVARLEPLAGEVVGQGAGARVFQHAPHLRLQHAAAAQRALAGQAEQLVVGHAAPEEVRQPAGQLEVVQVAHGARVVGTAIRLNPEEEVRRDEHRLQRQPDAGLEAVAVLLGQLDEAHQAAQLVVAHRPAVGALGEGAQDAAGRLLVLERHGHDALAGGGVGERLVHDLLGRSEVLLHQQRRQRQHVADVVEAVADVVGGEVVGGVEVDAEEVADGVVVLGPVEPPQGDPAGVLLAGAVGLEDDGVEPGVERLHLRGAGPRPVGRRHVASAQGVGHLLPRQPALEHRRLIRVGVQVQAAARPGALVAADAVARHQRGDVLLVIGGTIGGRRGRGQGGARPERCQGEGQAGDRWRANHAACPSASRQASGVGPAQAGRWAAVQAGGRRHAACPRRRLSSTNG